MRRSVRFIAFALVCGCALVASQASAHPDSHRGHRGPLPFDAIDTDGDGKISRGEAEAFRAARRAEIDADGDGFVSFEELQAQRQQHHQERARARFAALDADGDGKVAVDELPDRHGRLFEHLDRNQDGVIERDELPRRGHGNEHSGQH